jgi:hypothetical protein
LNTLEKTGAVVISHKLQMWLENLAILFIPLPGPPAKPSVSFFSERKERPSSFQLVSFAQLVPLVSHAPEQITLLFTQTRHSLPAVRF